jgi:hypothetical protein
MKWSVNPTKVWASIPKVVGSIPTRDAGTTGAAGASAPHAFCIHNFLGAVRVQTMGATCAQKI